MRNELLVADTVTAIADPTTADDLSDYSFSVHAAHFQNGGVPHITATGFAGAETVNLWKLEAGTWQKVYNGGSAVQLTATAPRATILSEGSYGVTKSNDSGIAVTVSMP